MPKEQKSSITKARRYTTEYPTEFCLNPTNLLYCKICQQIVCHERLSTVQKHRDTSKHQKALSKSGSSQKTQTFIQNSSSTEREKFTEKLVGSFVAADIPLFKLNHPAMKSLFSYMNHPLPSETTCRLHVSALAENDLDRIKQLLNGVPFFLIIDESEISGDKYLNTVVGSASEPSRTYLLDCTVLPGNVSHQTIIHAIDDAVKLLGADRSNFVLLLTDAAPYMIAATSILKQMFPRLFHVTCVAHLMHNCAQKVRAHYSNVDNLIARIKAATTKHQVRKQHFQEIGYPPQVVVTRWASWLSAAVYYADKLPDVKTIVDNWVGHGIIVAKAKEAIENETLAIDLLTIKRDYSFLTTMVTNAESASYTVLDAHRHLTKMDFGEDTCKIREYVNKRLLKNADLHAIINMSRSDISPSLYLLLQSCQATSACVERSFSILKKILTKERHFLPQNIVKYLRLRYNSL